MRAAREVLGVVAALPDPAVAAYRDRIFGPYRCLKFRRRQMRVIYVT